jgi:hypothetical protein
MDRIDSDVGALDEAVAFLEHFQDLADVRQPSKMIDRHHWCHGRSCGRSRRKAKGATLKVALSRRVVVASEWIMMILEHRWNCAGKQFFCPVRK